MSISQLVRGYRPLVAVAAPITGIQVAQIALTTTDLIMLGSMSVAAIAAGGLAITLYNQLRTMCVGVITAVGNMVAKAVGSGESRGGEDTPDQRAHDEVRQVVRAAFLVATLVAALGGLVLVALSYALTFFGQDSAVLDLARPMMMALAPGLIPMLWLNALRQFAVGMRRPGSLLGVTIVSVAINAVLDGAFINGWFGFPVLGLVGVGLATTSVQVLNFAAFYVIVRRDQTLAPLLSVAGWKADAATAGRIVRLGVPICLTYGSEAGITSVATLLMGAFGPVVLAANNIVTQMAYIVYQINIGLSQGSSILISRAVGQDKRHEAGLIARKALSLSTLAMALVAVVYALVPDWLLGLFLNGNADPALLEVGELLMVFAVFHQFLKGTQNISVGLLRGLGNTKVGFRMSLIGYWAIGLPVMLACAFALGLHGPGVWIGLCTGFGATAALLLHKFRQDVHTENAAVLSAATSSSQGAANETTGPLQPVHRQFSGTLDLPAEQTRPIPRATNKGP